MPNFAYTYSLSAIPYWAKPFKGSKQVPSVGLLGNAAFIPQRQSLLICILAYRYLTTDLRVISYDLSDCVKKQEADNTSYGAIRLKPLRMLVCAL